MTRELNAVIKKLTVQSLLVSMAIFLIACKPVPEIQPQEALKIMKKFGKLTPRCVGRFIVEIPDTFVLNTQGGQKIEGVNLQLTAKTVEMFASSLAARTAKLEKSFVIGVDQKYPMLRKVIPLESRGEGVVFDRAQSDESGGRLSRTLELFAWRDGYQVIATIDATDTTFPEDAKNEIAHEHLKTDVPEKLNKLISLYARVSGRADTEVPDRQGVCILNGFVSGPPMRDESVAVFYHLANAADVFFRISTSSVAPEIDTIRDRVKRIEPLLARSQGQVLRNGSRPVGELDGNEVAYSMLGDPDIEGRQIMTHKFIYEANSRKGNAEFPIVTVDLLNGERKPEPLRDADEPPPPHPEKATLSVTEASMLWDTVVQKIRRHPKAF